MFGFAFRKESTRKAAFSRYPPLRYPINVKLKYNYTQRIHLAYHQRYPHQQRAEFEDIGNRFRNASAPFPDPVQVVSDLLVRLLCFVNQPQIAKEAVDDTLVFDMLDAVSCIG